MGMSKGFSRGPNSIGKRHFWNRWGFKLVLILAVLYGFRFYQQQGLAGDQVKPLPGETLNGAKASLGDFRGRPRIIHFWATWCEVCRSMNSNIAALSIRDSVVTVASLSGNAEQVGVYLRSNGLSIPVVIDPHGRLAASYGVSAFPTTIVVDKRGKIRFAEIGYTTEIGLRVRLWLAEQVTELSIEKIKRWLTPQTGTAH
jgi:thiol-disulfide isomerase/thioredoxin